MTSQSRRSLLAVLGLAAVVVVIDVATKVWAENQLQNQPPMQVLGEWLQFTFTRNPGAAFSLGSDFTGLFTIAAVIVSVVAIWFARRVVSGWWLVALGLLLGGAVGNLVDRATQPPGFGVGEVRDFIQVPNWPVFNVADMAVVGSALLIVVLSLLGIPATEQPADEDAEESPAEASPVTGNGDA